MSSAGIPGIGVDVELVSRWIDPDLRLFTAAEIAHCRVQGSPAESFAGRWCAKEAVVKAFAGRAIVGIRDVEIRADERGTPIIALEPRLTEAGWRVGVSIAHQGPIAIAIAVVDGPDPATPTVPKLPAMAEPAPVVVLVSGSGTLLQALIDAARDPAYGVRIAAVGADRDGIAGLDRAERAGIPTFVCRVADFPSRADWDVALADLLDSYRPTFVVSAGFMKILGLQALARHTVINTHPALLPAFPGAHAVRDALAYGVKVTGTTCHFVDAGVDTGPIIEQHAVAVAPDDTEDTLHERIKVLERQMLVEVVGRMARHGYAVSGRQVRIGGLRA